MKNLHNINLATVAEWISIIDRNVTLTTDFENRLHEILDTQINSLLNSNLKEIKGKYWILKKKKCNKEVRIQFSLIAYKAETFFMEANVQQFKENQLQRLHTNLNCALQNEEYLKAAKIRDKINFILQEEDPAVA